MDEAPYSDPRLAATIGDAFVPVRVDVDRHPRVRERYNMGGFPSTVFLTPDGRVLSGATYLGVGGLRQVLDSVRATWDAEGAAAGRVPRSVADDEVPARDVSAGVEAHMVEQVAAAFDDEFGGWGSGATFPLADTVEFACKRDRDRATRTLEAVRTHLQDTYDGGFYRFAETRRWGDPHREKLTDENAVLVRAFTTAYLYTGEDAYRETAEATVDYLATTVWTGDAFGASQAEGDYYLLEPAEREAADAPAVDPTVLSDRNGLAAEGAARYAERALAHVLETLVDDGRVRHYDGPRAEAGPLADQARVLAGLTAPPSDRARRLARTGPRGRRRRDDGPFGRRRRVPERRPVRLGAVGPPAPAARDQR